MRIVGTDGSADVVVVGAGAGGLVAALTGRAHGLDVVVVEKTEYIGGTSALSHGGLWYPDHPLMPGLGIEDSAEAGLSTFDPLSAISGPRRPRNGRRPTFAERAAC